MNLVRLNKRKMKIDIKKQKIIRESLNKKLRIYYVASQIIALLAFLLLLPLLTLITFVIAAELLIAEKKLTCPFFIEERFTQGRTFTLYKFLSSSSSGQPLFLGGLLKQIYLDELPQLFSIVKGDMVFVGPRPNPIKEYNEILGYGYYAKALQKAGLTGGVQAAKGSENHGDLSLDEDYMYFCLNHSIIEILKKDFNTISKTISLMLRAEGI